MSERPSETAHAAPKPERKRKDLLQGPVGRTILELAGPMLAGVAAVILFNVVDTYFVSRLGAVELAAMSFTYPVTFLVVSVSMGLGVGMTVAVARFVGQGDREQVRKLTTHGLLLGNFIVVVVALVGLFTMGPLFRSLGASPELVEKIRDYMLPWYLGVGFLIVPMMGNSAIRATGDTKTPSFIMLFASVLNGILDPLLIFGWGPFPRLELAGAAIASVISWMLTFAAALWMLGKREQMLELAWPKWQEMKASWKRIFAVGLPASANNVVLPLAMGMLTRLVAGHGTESVAAFGVGGRVDSLALIGLPALALAASPFVGQNLGAGNYDRVQTAVKFCIKAALGYGVGIGALLILLAPPVARLFSDQPLVIEGIVHYLRIVPLGYAPFCVSILIGAIFNALNRALKTTFLIAFRLFVLTVPLAALGARLAGVEGIFGGIAMANLLAGCLAFWMIRHVLRDPEAALA
ncbi:MAG: MATE family efflux transporter [Acidobacteria bacterium]|nr:MATE family efflux transporter [Acidobacteriota bacterium]